MDSLFLGYLRISLLSSDDGSGFGIGNRGEMSLSLVEQDFSSYFVKIVAYLMIFQSGVCRVHCETLINHQIWQKSEEKPCSICLEPIFRLIPGPDPLLKPAFKKSIPFTVSTT